MSNTKKAPGIWVGQLFHFSGLVLLIFAVWVLWKYLEEPFPVVFWFAVAIPIMHQVFVWLAWRFEMLSKGTSKSIGFQWYKVIFFSLFFGRFVSLIALAWLDRGSLDLPIGPRSILGTLLALPGIYTMYSVKRYFGMSRAAGADHFDPQYRDAPFVNRGIFRFTSNGMYLYAFLLFWAIAVGFNSTAALAVAAFSHAYIWIHYYATEKPDMEFLYASGGSVSDS